MNKQVFIINGSGGVGKDTFVELVSRYARFPVMNFSSVDKVKEVAKLIGWSGKKTERDRKFLSDLKLLCTAYNDMPFESMREVFDSFCGNDAGMLFLHIREPEEIERAKQTFHAITLIVKRDAIKQLTSNMADARVYDYQYDIVIDNAGDLNDIAEQAQNFVSDFISGSLKQNY